MKVFNRSGEEFLGDVALSRNVFPCDASLIFQILHRMSSVLCLEVFSFASSPCLNQIQAERRNPFRFL